MKYLKFCMDYQNHPEIYENYVNRTYHDFLKHEKLTDNLIHFVMHSIAMVEADINTLEGLEATQKFLSSLVDLETHLSYILHLVLASFHRYSLCFLRRPESLMKSPS